MFNSSSDNPAAAVSTLARIIQIGGCILSGIILFVGFIISTESYYPGAIIFSSIVVGALLVAGTYITALILRLFASIADNTSGCASSLRTCMYHLNDIAQVNKKITKEEESISASTPQQTPPPVQPARPMQKWICPHCGQNNLDCDNICNNCGQMKAE